MYFFNFYSSNNQGNRGGQSPSSNTNNKNSNSISEKSTGLWNNWQTRGAQWAKNGKKCNITNDMCLSVMKNTYEDI